MLSLLLFCLAPPRTEFIWGLESIVSYDHSNASYTLGLVVIGLMLILQAFVLAYYPSTLYRGVYVASGLPAANEAALLNSRAHTFTQMRWIVVGYTAITGLFAWLRAIFDTGKPLLIGAALHNLAEFCILVNLYFSYKNVSKYQRVGVMVVSAVITAVVISPSFKLAVFIEQQFGVMFDYLLFLTFLHLYTETSNIASDGKNSARWQDKRLFQGLWRNGFIGATTHFGQIWTLILGALGVGRGTWVQALIEGTLYFSAPITFLYYAWFALEWDRLVEADALETVQNYSVSLAEKGDYSGSSSSRVAPAAMSASSSSEESALIASVGANSPLLAKNAEISKIWKRLLLALGLAFATILGPALLPMCSSPAPTPSVAASPSSVSSSAYAGAGVSALPLKSVDASAVPSVYCAESDGSLSGLTLVEAKSQLEFPALIDALTPLVPLSRSTPGNIYYDLLQHVDGIHVTFFEKWASKDILMQHIASPGVQKIFGDPYVRGLMASEVLNGPYLNIEPCASQPLPKLHVAFNFQLQSSLDGAFKILATPTDCTWVQGCVRADVVDSSHRKLNFQTGVVMSVSFHSDINSDHSNATYQYSVESITGAPTSTLGFTDYAATITLQKNAQSTASAPLLDVAYASEFNAIDNKNPQARQGVLDYVKQDFLKNRIPFLKQLFLGK